MGKPSFTTHHLHKPDIFHKYYISAAIKCCLMRDKAIQSNLSGTSSILLGNDPLDELCNEATNGNAKANLANGHRQHLQLLLQTTSRKAQATSKCQINKKSTSCGRYSCWQKQGQRQKQGSFDSTPHTRSHNPCSMLAFRRHCQMLLHAAAQRAPTLGSPPLPAVVSHHLLLLRPAPVSYPTHYSHPPRSPGWNHYRQSPADAWDIARLLDHHYNNN